MSAGHARRRGENRWELRWRAAGRLRTVTVTAKSERDAQKQLAVKVAEAERGIVANAPARLTVSDWIDQWFAAADFKITTRTNYRSFIERYLRPRLGSIRLKDLDHLQIRMAFNEWKAGGHRGRPLARSTLQQLKVVLSGVLSEAVRADLIAKSPLDKLKARRGQKNPLPVGDPPEAEPLSQEMINQLLASDQNCPYFPGLVLAIAAGMRRGEICGLRWSNVDLDAGTVRVVEQLVPAKGGSAVSTTKSENGVRSITLPPFAVELLHSHRLRVAEQLLRVGVRLSSEHTVCMWQDGRPLVPTSFTKWCGARGFKLHAARHAHASALLNSSESVPLKAIAKRLGHSDIKTTIGVYGHLAKDADDKAAEVIDKAFGAR